MTDTCKAVLNGTLGGHEQEVLSHPHHRLHIVVSRGRGLLKAPTRNLSVGTGFGLAVLGNFVSRSQLANHLARVVIGDEREPAFLLVPTVMDMYRCATSPIC